MSSQEPFVAQLAELCRAEPTRAKWVFAPAHAIGATLGDRLAREGTSWANLRFVTPLDIAVRMAAPHLLARGLNPADEPLGPPLFMRLLLELPGEPGYFKPMAAHPSMADALWRAIRELRYAGLGAADLPSPAFASRAKYDELVALIAAYDRHLAERQAADLPMVLAEAAHHLDWCPIRPDDLVTEIPDAWWSPLVRRFLDTLPGRRLRPRAPAIPALPSPTRARIVRPDVEPVEADPTTDASRLRFLLDPSAAPPPRHDGSLALFHAGGRDAEVAEVLRRVAESGASLDQVEIVCTSREDAVLVWERAQRLDWPVTVSAGLPVTLTRPGRLLLRFCEWAGGGFASADLRRLLQSGDCAPVAFAEDENDSDTSAALTPGQAARLLLKAQTTWGRGTYAPSLARLAAEFDRRAQNSDASDADRAWNGRKAAQTRTLAAWVDGLLASLPQPKASSASAAVVVSDVAKSAATFLTSNASRASALDAVALVALESALGELADALGTHEADVASALGLVRARVESMDIAPARPRPGALHVSLLADAGYDGRRLVYVIGLQEGGVFPPAIEDPILLDAERRAIGDVLRTSTEQLDESVAQVLARLAAIGASASQVCLSFSCRDTRQFRETFPSWLVLQAFRLMQGDGAATYADLHAYLGEPCSAVPDSPERALTAAEWWLTGVARKSKARAAVLKAFPSLAAGVRAEESRASVALTEYDGYVPAAGPVLDPTAASRGSSATTLERAAECPFRYFLQQGLGIRALEEPKADADVWLDPLTKGSELHDLFARFMRTLRDERRRPDATRDAARLREWGTVRLAAIAQAMPPSSDEVFQRESRAFLEDLESFLSAEVDGIHGRDPVGFEVPFGYALEPDGEPLASPEPLVLDLGGKRMLRLHGRIDRVNRVKPGAYEVVDYKTGGFWADKWRGTFAGGTRLQHALYGLALVSLLKASEPRASVVQGAYVFPAVKGHRQRKVIPAPTKARTMAVLRDLVDVIASGVFVSADGNGACEWCDFAAACRPGAVETVQVMADDEAITALDPFRRLRSHE